MNLKRLIYGVCASALALVCGSAAAQSSQKFVGPALGISVSVQGNKTPLSSQVGSLNGKSVQASDTAASLVGSWGWALSDHWVVSLGAAWDIGTTDIGKINYTSGASQTLLLKTREHLSLSISPGYRLNPDLLLYGRLSNHQLRGEYVDSASRAGTVDHAGVGVGLGLAVSVAAKWELRVEYEDVKYDAKTVRTTSGKPEQSLLSMGLLYKF